MPEPDSPNLKSMLVLAAGVAVVLLLALLLRPAPAPAPQEEAAVTALNSERPGLGQAPRER
ncbi:MAG: hypothetical protein J6333_04085, partial [Planctomycetes bacterium]|nr:hypothetical protein [Planctomycetota bacterium]